MGFFLAHQPSQSPMTACHRIILTEMPLGDNCVNTAIVDVGMALKAARNGNTINRTANENKACTSA